MKYEVVFESFTQRHFIKTYAKKYKGAWDKTFAVLQLEFSLIDLLFEKTIAETIVDSKEIKICKTEFKIVGTEVSRHASGNRCIIAIHKNSNTVHVLLVYGKNDLNGTNETVAWKMIVRENYKEYAELL